MELTAKQDIEAPRDRVFAALSDFDTVERQAMRRGLAVRRLDASATLGAGMAWHVVFTYRGKTREAQITLTDFVPPERMVFHSVTGGLEAETVIDCVALSRNRTRIGVTSVLEPKTLSARLLVQSLRLARGGAEKRFRARMADYAAALEDRLGGAA